MELVSKDIWQHQHLQWDFSIPIDSWLSSDQGRTPSLQDQQHLCVGPWSGQKWIPLFWCYKKLRCNMFPWNLINQFDCINKKKKVCIFHLLCVSAHPFEKLSCQDSNKQISMLIGSDDKHLIYCSWRATHSVTHCNQLQYIRTVPIFTAALKLS